MTIFRYIYMITAAVGLTRGRSIVKPRRLSTSGTVNGVLGRLRGQSRVGGPGLMSSTTGVKATLTTALAGANNDLKFTDRLAGPAGNNKRVRIVVAGVSTPLTITRSGDDFTINSATDGASAASSTANAIISKWRTLPDVNSRMDIALAPANDGTGIVAALGFTNLATGT